jgi:hypothetical protein
MSVEITITVPVAGLPALVHEKEIVTKVMTSIQYILFIFNMLCGQIYKIKKLDLVYTCGLASFRMNN